MHFTHTKHLTVLLLTLLTCACGEFSYKRGASQVDLATSKKECQAEAKTANEYKSCMSAKGWLMKNFDEEEATNEQDPVIEIKATNDNRGASSQAAPSTATTEVAKSPAEKSSEPAKISKPDDIFKVNSWWKFGGTDGALKIATEQCVANLGEEYRPNPVTQEAKRAFLVCMKKAGWSGLKAQ